MVVCTMENVFRYQLFHHHRHIRYQVVVGERMLSSPPQIAYFLVSAQAVIEALGWVVLVESATQFGL